VHEMAAGALDTSCMFPEGARDTRLRVRSFVCAVSVCAGQSCAHVFRALPPLLECRRPGREPLATSFEKRKPLKRAHCHTSGMSVHIHKTRVTTFSGFSCSRAAPGRASSS